MVMVSVQGVLFNAGVKKKRKKRKKTKKKKRG